MARRTPPGTRGREARPASAAVVPVPYNLTPGVLITFRPSSAKTAVARLSDAAGVKNVAHAADFESHATVLSQTKDAGLIVFDSLGVAVADVDPDQETSIAAMASDDSAIASMEPEPIFFAFSDGVAQDFGTYLRGYRDAVNHLYEQARGRPGLGAEALLTESARDTSEATWGITVTKAIGSRFTGRGVKIAVLDTGLDLDHPDFGARQVTSRSFIPGQEVEDDNGHGTHCTGTACGPRNPARGPRFGVAYEAEIFIGKVLSNQGSALGRSTLAGIEWAVANGCHVVSMSLGARVSPGQGHSTAFENTAREGMRRGTLIVAAAGNDSRRSQGLVDPVSSPANCPSVMAVGAVDRLLKIADFSNGSVNAAGKVDLVGPGVEVYSSAPEPSPTPQPPRFRRWTAQYDTISGTSMATPHVAGIAALLRQEKPDATPAELWRILTSRAKNLPLPTADAGAGLVQA